MAGGHNHGEAERVLLVSIMLLSVNHILELQFDADVLTRSNIRHTCGKEIGSSATDKTRPFSD